MSEVTTIRVPSSQDDNTVVEPETPLAGKSLHGDHGHFESIDEITVKYANEIRSLREMLVHGSESNDVTVYRYLRGYRFNIRKAANALDETLKWRAENHMDDIRERAKDMHQCDFPHFEKMMKCYPHNIHHGCDRKGQPLSLERIGHTNVALLSALITVDDMIEYQKHHLEMKACLISKLTNESGTVFRASKIIDLDGLGVHHLHREGLRILKAVIGMGQAHYPEMLGNLYIINAPWIFQAGWKIVKPWLKPMTLEKIQILGRDYTTVLRERIDPSNLPQWAGGDCNCDGGCVREIDPNHGMTEVSIGARKKRECVG